MASKISRRAALRLRSVVALLATSVGLVMGSAAYFVPAAHAATSSASALPLGNVAPVPNFESPAYCPNYPVDESTTCLNAIVAAIDNARAKEAVGNLVLPSNFATLTPSQQLYVIVNKERVDRGLPALIALTTPLNSLAQSGANNATDPSGGNYTWGSNWAGGEPNPLAADYGWMYDDGYGGPNVGCTTPSSPGCWGHRKNILLNFGSSQAAMGAASAMVSGRTSYATIAASSTTGPYDFTWSQENSQPALALPTGDAGYYGAANSATLPSPVVAMMRGPLSKGYWLVTAKGNVYNFGDASWFGSLGATSLPAPIVSAFATPDGKGYWLVTAKGNVYNFGDASWFGSPAAHGGVPSAVTAGFAAPSGGGYWLVTAGGNVYNFGNAPWLGSTANKFLGTSIANGIATNSGKGYWLAGASGGVYSF